ncbi:MAG TPA: hypothetical protein EYM84_04985 [Flavobacteriales bacterium]|nr:hypothetical protein [Flavobacteriales bacterium]
MMRDNTISVLFMGIFLLLTLAGNSQVDSIATQPYKSVNIGKQLWMTENLDVSRFRNGDLIPEARTSEEWRAAVEEEKPAWCYYNNDPKNGKMYGKMYNWYAVNDPRGLAPLGWHIPSDEEWIKLAEFLGGKEIAGEKLKSTAGWEEKGNGTDANGFGGLPGGFRYYNGFFYIGKYSYFWSSSEASASSAWSRVLYYNNNSLSRYFYSKRSGFAIRCLQD